MAAAVLLAGCSADNVEWSYETGAEHFVQVHDCKYNVTGTAMKCLITNRSEDTIRAGSFRVTGYKSNGVKIDDDTIDASLEPGETAEELFALFARKDGLAKVIVKQR